MAGVTARTARGILSDTPGDRQFYCVDGRTLKNLPELESALREMAEETFRYHSNETKNDFSIWVRDVIGDAKLSRDLHKSTSRAQAAKHVASRIAWLRDKIRAKS